MKIVKVYWGESITKYTTISYDNVQNVGSKLYFQSLNLDRRPFYCIILAIGTLATCMSELKNYEDLTLHFPLVAADYMITKDNLELLNEPYQHNSCRCEPLRINLITEKVETDLTRVERQKLKLDRSVQQKRGPPHRQLHLCANKRKKMA